MKRCNEIRWYTTAVGISGQNRMRFWLFYVLTMLHIQLVTSYSTCYEWGILTFQRDSGPTYVIASNFVTLYAISQFYLHCQKRRNKKGSLFL